MKNNRIFLLLLLSVFWASGWSANTKKSSKESTIYQDWQKSASKYKITKELFKTVFDVQEKQKKKSKIRNNVSSSSSRFRKHSGKRIRKIYVRQEDVFSGKNFFSRLGNGAHMDTREFIILNNLFFQEYSIVNPELLAENEKFLSGLSYIKDAEFFLVPVKGSLTFVDLVLVIRDKWSIGADGDFTDLDKFRLGGYDKNFFGFGNEFEYKAKYNKDNSPQWGHDFSYEIRNVDRSFMDLKVDYYDDYSKQKYGGSLNRGYISGKKYGGGGSWYIVETKEQKSEVDSTLEVSVPRAKSVDLDFWIGRKFKFRGSFLGFDQVAWALRHKSQDFEDRPEGVTADSLRGYHDIEFFRLASFSMSKQLFYRSSLIYGFGVAEHIPYGKNLELVYGKESGEFWKRDYFGISYAQGKFYKNVGYLYNKVAMGGFWLDDESRMEDLTVRLKVSYFSLLYKWGHYYTRYFANLDYVTSVNRSLKDSISISDDEIRELSWDKNDEQKLVLSTEMVTFAPWNLAGFKFALFSFADGGYLAANENIAVGGSFASSIGLGVRIRNENLVFKTLQLRIAYFPTRQEDGDYKFRLSGEKGYSLPTLDAGSPSVIEYY